KAWGAAIPPLSIGLQLDGSVLFGSLDAPPGCIGPTCLTYDVVRASPHGDVDASFVKRPHLAADLVGVTALPNAKFVPFGAPDTGAGCANLLLERHDVDGAVDASFGVAGRATVPPRSCDDSFDMFSNRPDAIAHLSDGSLVVAGRIGTHPNNVFP